MNIPIIVLAAGASSRMGRPKQLLPFGQTTLLGHVVDTALAAGLGCVFPVLGAHAAAIRAALGTRRVCAVENPDWSLGMGSSIRAGMRAVLQTEPAADAVLILLGDQPCIGPALLQEFATRSLQYRGQIVAASYAGTTGVPALFPRVFFQELLALDPEQGAKPLLRRAADITLIQLGENPDIDTPEDYESLARWLVESLTR